MEKVWSHLVSNEGETNNDNEKLLTVCVGAVLFYTLYRAGHEWTCLHVIMMGWLTELDLAIEYVFRHSGLMGSWCCA